MGPLEETRLRKELEDLRHAVDCDRDINEARIAAEAEVERLRARVRELEEERRWREWSEEAPQKHGQKCLVIAEGTVSIDEWHRHDAWLQFPNGLTHWRPIGELPRGNLNA